MEFRSHPHEGQPLVEETEQTAMPGLYYSAGRQWYVGIDRNPMSRCASHTELRAPVARAILDGEAAAGRRP
ncbi:hypothetical protein [Streptomyces sp. R41]|uniref:Uncharacterized protein n=1 Tax=Streptomyces sp. R41 TaxID=3238632 RepID=A0AB39RXB9_9ACTN